MEQVHPQRPIPRRGCPFSADAFADELVGQASGDPKSPMGANRSGWAFFTPHGSCEAFPKAPMQRQASRQLVPSRSADVFENLGQLRRDDGPSGFRKWGSAPIASTSSPPLTDPGLPRSVTNPLPRGAVTIKVEPPSYRPGVIPRSEAPLPRTRDAAPVRGSRGGGASRDGASFLPADYRQAASMILNPPTTGARPGPVEGPPPEFAWNAFAACRALSIEELEAKSAAEGVLGRSRGLTRGMHRGGAAAEEPPRDPSPPKGSFGLARLGRQPSLRLDAPGGRVELFGKSSLSPRDPLPALRAGPKGQPPIDRTPSADSGASAHTDDSTRPAQPGAAVAAAPSQAYQASFPLSPSAAGAGFGGGFGGGFGLGSGGGGAAPQPPLGFFGQLGPLGPKLSLSALDRFPSVESDRSFKQALAAFGSQPTSSNMWGPVSEAFLTQQDSVHRPNFSPRAPPQPAPVSPPASAPPTSRPPPPDSSVSLIQRAIQNAAYVRSYELMQQVTYS